MTQNEQNKEGMLPLGQILQMNKYRVDRYLSSGGFGNTYVVTNMEFEERMALKEFFMKGISERGTDLTTVSISNADNKEQFEAQKDKFKKEARRLRKLQNPHIVQVHDLFEENGTAYYAMDYVEGESLSARLKRTHQPLTEAETLKILNQVLDALADVHAQGIWHLDLKPGNIMVDKSGNVKVIDFGASKQMSANEGYTTTTTAMCYTPGYAPTEQIDQKMELIGPWTDLYALGGTLYNLLTCNQPPTVSEMQEEGAFVYPNPVSPKTRHLIKWMMTPKRQARPQSVKEVRAFLNRVFIPADNQVESDEETVIGPRRNKVIQPRPQISQLSDEEEEPEEENRSYVKTISVAAIAIVLIGALVFRVISDQERETTPSAESQIRTALQQNTVTNSYFESALGVCSYTGPIDDNEKPHGIGEASFTDGRLYKGPFVHGRMEGSKAYFRYDNGDVFEGSFRDNSFSEGRYTMKDDGSYFVGNFKKGQPNEGIWYDKNGNKL